MKGKGGSTDVSMYRSVNVRGRNGSCSSRMDFPLIYLQFATLHRFISLMLLNCCFFCMCV